MTALPLTSDGQGVLSVTDVEVRFGAVVALDGVSINVSQGMQVGLIGANGAGKSVLFDVITGFTKPASGQVMFLGDDLTRVRAAVRARRGLRRTFQNAELFDDLSVWENVSVGGDGSHSQALDQLLTDVGLGPWKHHLARDVPAGLRRMVDLARGLAGNPKVLLLDEPAAGLADDEVDGLVSILNSMCRDRGIAILVVEHDMTLIKRVCQFTYVLDFGRLIAEGTPEEIMNSRIVQDAYLGELP